MPSTTTPSSSSNTLSKSQLHGIGACPPWVWNTNHPMAIAKLHPPPLPESIMSDDDSDDEQTFRQFSGLAKRPPNEKGTGRWKVTQQRRTIGILPLDDDNATRQRLEPLQAYMTAFFHGMKIVMLPTQGICSEMKAKNTNRKRGGLWLGKDKLNTIPMVQGQPHVEVFSLFDALVNHVPTDHYCIMGVTSRPLVEEWTDDNGIQELSPVEGRACGDRVCVVSSSTDDDTSLRAFLGIATHEILHCFGFDHCTTFHCLMNPVSVKDYECLFLSPLNLKKWVQGVLGYRDEAKAATYVVERYQKLQDVLSQLALKKDAHWMQKKLKVLLASVPSSSSVNEDMASCVERRQKRPRR